MDRISNLPDELLVKILSYVPTKEAVSTSVLSKRWEYLWIWSPNLEFGHRDCSEDRCKRLQSFLDRNLPLHRAPVIETFRLESCSSHFKPESISKWVSTAVSHCLRELDILHEDTVPTLIMPSNLFACKSLVILKLVGEILLDVPNMVSLPSLKTLKLQRVRYFNEETLQRLLSNCPVLEDLVVDLHDYDDYTTGKLTVAVPSLQSLSLCMPYGQDIDGYVIETPNLKYFKLRDHFRNDHYGLIENMPCLIEAYVDVVKLDDIKSLIGSITSVKRLSICSKVMCDEGFVFNQLEHLDVCICAAYFSNQLFWLLKASPNLQGLHLFFIEDDHEPYHPVEDWNQPSTVPECVLSSLQSLNWSFYTGKPQEKDIVVYILEHAVHLKTATITTTESDVPKFEMLKELALSSRASTTCQLMFE